jgi:hypothetical protein
MGNQFTSTYTRYILNDRVEIFTINLFLPFIYNLFIALPIAQIILLRRMIGYLVNNELGRKMEGSGCDLI